MQKYILPLLNMFAYIKNTVSATNNSIFHSLGNQ